MAEPRCEGSSMLKWGETFNHVYGRTTNPHNRTLSPGGSSGGEGALVALKGSPLGVGTDIGGSVRIPSACCGIYGLRPSYHRVPYRGASNTMVGQETIQSVIGPMSNSIAGLKVFFKTILDHKPWTHDPIALRKAWDEDLYQLVEHGNAKELCFAILWDDGVWMPTPPLRRAMEITKAALLAAGHKVIDWEPLRHLEILTNSNALYSADGGKDFREALKPTGEPLIETMVPEGVKYPFPDLRIMSESAPLDAYTVWQGQWKKTQDRQAYFDHWSATVTRTGTGRPVDAIIAPVAAYPAPPHGLYRAAPYTTIFNVLDYPGVAVPITTVDQALDQKGPPHKFRNEEERAVYEFYSPEKFKDAPVGLQVVGRTYHDEAVIAMAEIVDDAVKKFKKN